MSTIEIVTAPTMLHATAWSSGWATGWVRGAWATQRQGRRTHTASFVGTHQRVPFTTTGRTPGRAMRRMRRALAAARIPVV